MSDARAEAMEDVKVEVPPHVTSRRYPGGSPVTTTIRLDPEIKDEAAEVFSSLGMSFNTGIEVYIRSVARNQCIPFDLTLNGKGGQRRTN